MSDGINLQTGDQSGYSVKSILGCRVVFGPVPLSDLAMLMHGFSKKALMAVDIADRIGASLVIGEPKDIDALRKEGLPVSAKRHADYLAASALGLHAVAMWLRTGERGASSNALCKRIFTVPDLAGTAHPLDPDDLRRCLLFLDASGAHDRVALMADVSPAWAALVARWDEIVATYREEASGKSAPRTYALMKEALLAGDER